MMMMMMMMNLIDFSVYVDLLLNTSADETKNAEGSNMVGTYQQ